MPLPKSIMAEARQLRQELNEHNYSYYVLDAPSVTDQAYSSSRSIQKW
jgi:DNA ligase (NAD+)